MGSVDEYAIAVEKRSSPMDLLFIRKVFIKIYYPVGDGAYYGVSKRIGNSRRFIS